MWSGAYLTIKQAEGRGDEARLHEVPSRSHTGETSDGASNAEGRVLTCFACFLSIGKGQTGTKTGKEFSKGSLDECVIFLTVRHFSMVVIFKCTRQMNDQGSMWDTGMFSSLEPAWDLRIVSASVEEGWCRPCASGAACSPKGL